MIRRTRDDWLLAGGRPHMNARAHLDDVVRRRGLEVLGSDPTGHKLLELKARTGCSVKALADAVGLPYHTVYFRVRSVGGDDA